MDRIAGFFGGVALGGLLSAACGLDLSPSEPLYRERYAESQRTVSQLVARVESAERDRDRFASGYRRIEKEARRNAEDLELARLRAADRTGQLRELEEALETAREEVRTIRGGLVEATSELAIERQRSAELADARSRLIDVLFTKPLGPEDRDLVREILLGRGTLAEKIRWVIRLRQHNPELLLTIGDLRPPSPDLVYGPEGPPARRPARSSER
ncbi:MAG TPA: hypothetical protein VK116_08960 [Planctomycetota bacterium]|nr:hypothetical protein [Planctomycetota bacterium]